MIPVEGNKGLFRDEDSNAIINHNTSEYEDYMRIKNKIMSENRDVKMMKDELEMLKSLVSELLNK
jgi:hypothetical protein